MTTTTSSQTTDQRILPSGRTWEQFKLIQQGFEDSPGVRLGFYDGEIEILLPGREYEVCKTIIGFLLELFFVASDIEFEPTGSMTQEKTGLVSAEADESYCIGTSKLTPDLVIEVIFASGGLMKLRRYQALGVPEVWFWQDGVFTLYRLRESGYEQIPHSEIPELSTLNLELLTRCVLMGATSRLEAMRQFRAGLHTR